ncbi:WYL domain-containing protein [Aliidiomarina sedimenti]|uniref:WYL domain-containing protein n=1 Tax=Aliidiomarina sedimenti TaxID=1933879 RepID=A0ABY0C117_9GAMM|nr:WYL domain-containing protein [Aliidiomarina sedimenti]RUO31560.1 WYL domain-containing protein [Aliidiomarina sedimenti]
MLDDLSYAQKQRLAYIDFCLLFKGSLCRIDLVEKFAVGLSAGSRDFNLYKELAPDNLSYDVKLKRYFQTAEFQPLFEHDAQRTLAKLANNISDGFDAIGDVTYPVEPASNLNVPNIFLVAKVVQATLNKFAVEIEYTSLTSGNDKRVIVPHSIVDNGLRWHVRAFDRKSESFRDFVLTRIHKVNRATEAKPFESPEADHEWNRIITLQFEPHPNNIKYPAAIELDYGMQNGMSEVNVRAAMVGYLLRRWNVDCTENAELTGPEFQLWLRNRHSLMNTSNLAIAPGYKVA